MKAHAHMCTYAEREREIKGQILKQTANLKLEQIYLNVCFEFVVVFLHLIDCQFCQPLQAHMQKLSSQLTK